MYRRHGLHTGVRTERTASEMVETLKETGCLGPDHVRDNQMVNGYG